MRAFALWLGLVILAAPGWAQNWPSWRGPDQNGVAQPGDRPVEWSPEKNIRWKIDLPGPGSSTPMVWGDKIVLTYGADGKNTVVCYNLAGKEEWTHELGTLTPGKHRKASGANPSPVTDGQNVWVYFKSGDLACLDLQGKVVWHKNLQQMYGKDDLWWDLGTSPVLTENGVVVAVMQEENSYVVALEKTTGAELWKTDRNFKLPKENGQSYTTPQVYDQGGEQRIAVVGADHVTSYRAANGEEVWQCGGLNPGDAAFFRSISSPVISGNMLIVPYSRGKSLTAIKLGGSGDVTKTHVAWKGETAADVPTPAARDGQVFVLTDKGTLLCLKGETGETIWEIEMPRDRAGFSASPIVAGDKIYCVRENGVCHVVQVADGSAEVIATNSLDDRAMTVASPVPVQDVILIRSEEALWCVGK
jgi:outer membrane protein assembly factor BamB